MRTDKNTEDPLVEKEVLLEKFPGKGGWTFARMPEIVPDKKSYFGWRKVKGFIDNYEFKNQNLMPLGGGQLFLAVKAEIRKKINKNAGDFVKVVLFDDQEPTVIPEEIIACLKDEPTAFKNFEKLTDAEKNRINTWINSAKSEDTKIDRIAKLVNTLASGDKLTV